MVGSHSLTGDLQYFLWNTGMIDRGFKGTHYTWSNGREGRGLIIDGWIAVWRMAMLWFTPSCHGYPCGSCCIGPCPSYT